MTVDELRKKLKKMSKRGHGSARVVIEDCDPDYMDNMCVPCNLRYVYEPNDADGNVALMVFESVI